MSDEIRSYRTWFTRENPVDGFDWGYVENGVETILGNALTFAEADAAVEAAERAAGNVAEDGNGNGA